MPSTKRVRVWRATWQQLSSADKALLDGYVSNGYILKLNSLDNTEIVGRIQNVYVDTEAGDGEWKYNVTATLREVPTPS